MLYHTLIRTVIKKYTAYPVSFRPVDLVIARGPHVTPSSRWFLNTEHHVPSQLTSCHIVVDSMTLKLGVSPLLVAILPLLYSSVSHNVLRGSQWTRDQFAGDHGYISVLAVLKFICF